MRALVWRRLLLLPPLLLAMSVLAFALLAAAPGDPVLAEAVRQGLALSPESLAALRAELGLDGTWFERYLRWLQALLQGDWGRSLSSGLPVLPKLLAHLGPTLWLSAVALLLALPLAVGAGLAAALARRGWARAAWRVLALLLVSLPGYWLGLLALYTLGVALGWVQVLGTASWADLWLPALVLALGVAAPVSRVIRERALQVMSEDPFRLAVAQGLPASTLVLTRVLPATLLPSITLWANACGALLGGVVIIEAIFNWPGLGQLVLQAIAERDVPLLQAYLLLMGLLYVLVNLLADMLSAALDARLRGPLGAAAARDGARLHEPGTAT